MEGRLATHSDGWVIDGNYAMVRDLILPKAAAVVWLDLPFWVVYWRLARRTTLRSFWGAPLWNGNREKLRQTFFSRDSMLLWGLTVFWRTRRSIGESLAAFEQPGPKVYRLRTPGQVASLLRRAQRVDA